jgi:hypothetical protein
MGHDVQKAVRGAFLASVMGTPSPATADTRGYRRAREDLAIRKYNEMVSNLKALLTKLGLGATPSSDEWSNKRTYDALTSVLSGYDIGYTIRVLEDEIIHDVEELARLQTIEGGSNYVFDPLMDVRKLNISLEQKVNYLNQYKTGQIFIDVGGIVEKIQKSNDTKRAIEVQKERILFEDEASEQSIILDIETKADKGISDYESYVTKRNQDIEEYNIWVINEQKIEKERQELLKSSFIGTEDITIPTTEPTVIPHNDEETEYIDDITPETIPVKKIGAGILALGAIGVLLALRFKS